jgi:hypothetical protein
MVKYVLLAVELVFEFVFCGTRGGMAEGDADGWRQDRSREGEGYHLYL